MESTGAGRVDDDLVMLHADAQVDRTRWTQTVRAQPTTATAAPEVSALAVLERNQVQLEDAKRFHLLQVRCYENKK